MIWVHTHMMMKAKRIPRLGIGGPVGSGKTMLIEKIVPILASKGYKVGIISNDVVSREDADRMRHNLAKEQGILSEDLVIGLATGGCPHTAVREDPSMNISVIEEMESKYSYLDLIIIESGGDNITTTFSPALADYFIYKIDLAPHVGADLKIMERDAKDVRGDKPHVLVNCKTGQGIEQATEHIIRDILFEAVPKTLAKN